MKRYFLPALLFPFFYSAAQQRPGADSVLTGHVHKLEEVVVTGQFEPQSSAHSVYMVRSIDSERIRLRGATNLVQILNTEPGVRFTNDLTLGTSDISLMGMSGTGVKVLLDGVPLTDRSEVRESLGQIDINTIERIEIVEGPMSVNYGTDALAGVVNIITKKAVSRGLAVTAKVQEESAGREYSGFGTKGSHNQSLMLSSGLKNWSFSGSIARNNFGGWRGQSAGRELDWNPKDQLLGGVRAGYSGKRLNAWYRLNATDETITLFGTVNQNSNTATDKDFVSRRFFHQAQAEWMAGSKMNFTGAAAWTSYSRRTRTTNLNVLNGDRRLSADTGSQDVSRLNSLFFRGTMQYRMSSKVNLQPGIEISRDGASGDRILGSPEIGDYAFFISSELKLFRGAIIRPGFRMIHNSVYNAPPLIPSLNTLFNLNKRMNLRFSYARGFRAPALRELYFSFFDASHSIVGNRNLKAEYSNSFNGSLVWRTPVQRNSRLALTLSSFYNLFDDLIAIGTDPANPDVNSYVNIDKFRTAGASLQTDFDRKTFRGTLNFSWIGRYNRFSDDQEYGKGLPEFNWSPELSSNITYSILKAATSFNLAYKFNGREPKYEAVQQEGGTTVPRLAEVSAYSLADLSINKSFRRFVTLSFGLKNIFNVTRVNNTSVDVGSAHSTGGPVPVSYGRSFFLGLSLQLSGTGTEGRR